MKSFWGVVNHVLKGSDIVLIVMDARFPDLSLNPELVEKAKDKPIIYVLNKCDLAKKEDLEKWKQKYKNGIFVSAKQRFGMTILKHKILEIAQGRKVAVGVVGYPNTGKSSLINALKGHKAAGTSPQSGFTKGKQLIKISDTVYVLDTPGVLPYIERDETKHGIIGAVDADKVKDPESIALQLIETKKEDICAFYEVQGEDAEEIFEAIGKKAKMLKKGGLVNEDATARMIIRDWQRGRIVSKN